MDAVVYVEYGKSYVTSA